MSRGSQEREIRAALSYFLKGGRQTSSSPCFAVESPKRSRGVLLCMGATYTRSNTDNQVSTWLPAEQNIKLCITAIYKLNAMLELLLLSPRVWISDGHDESHPKAMSPTACVPKLTLQGLRPESCWHGNNLADRISVNWHCDHATERQHRLCLNFSLQFQDKLCCQGF